MNESPFMMSCWIHVEESPDFLPASSILNHCASEPLNLSQVVSPHEAM